MHGLLVRPRPLKERAGSSIRHPWYRQEMARHQRKPAAQDQPFVFDRDGRGGRGEGPGPRGARLQHLLYEEIDRLFRLEVNDRRLQGLRPLWLQLSPDLRNAKVLYGMLPGAPPVGDKELKDALQRVSAFLRARIAEALVIKRVPDLHFHRDRIAESALRVQALLETEKQPPPEG